LELATSEYVIFLDADDYMEGNLVGGLVSAASKNSASIAFATLVRESPAGVRAPPLFYPSETSTKELLVGWLRGQCIGNGATIWRRDFLNSIGRWNESVMQGQDVELGMRAFLADPPIAFTSEGALIYCDHNSSTRVSRQISEEILQNRLSFMQGLAQSADRNSEEVRTAFADELYYIAKRAAALGYRRLSAESRAAARGLGLRGDRGSFAWRLACMVLGFEVAARTSGKVRGLENRLRQIHG
jgi:GT2 family glycosyltransferase